MFKKFLVFIRAAFFLIIVTLTNLNPF